MFPLEVHVYSQTEADGDVEVKLGDKTLGRRKVQLARGMNRVAFAARITEDARPPLTLDAEVRVTGDAFPDNNRFRKSIVFEGKPRVLYIESRTESAKYLKQALELEGFVVDTISPSSIHIKHSTNYTWPDGSQLLSRIRVKDRSMSLP